MDRRYFLKASGFGLASFGLMSVAPNFLHQFAAAQTKGGAKGRKVLVTIFQRGAVDGLNMLVPYGDSEYYDLRPTIAIPKPGKTDGAVDLDGHFGLHPSLAVLAPFYKSGQFVRSRALVRPTIRALILTRRTIWNPAHPAANQHPTAG